MKTFSLLLFTLFLLHCSLLPLTWSHTSHLFRHHHLHSTDNTDDDDTNDMPALPPPSGYDEDLARLMTVFSAAAYIPNPQYCINNVLAMNNITNLSLDDWHNVTHTFTGTLYNSLLYGYLAVDHVNQRWILSCRGTWGTQQLLNEIRYSTATTSTHDHTHLIQSYFYSAATLLRDDALAAIKETVTVHPDYQPYLTGHSLGAALSLLLAYEAFQLNLFVTSPIAYTIGQPRLGNIHFAVYMDLHLKHHYRIIHRADMIPHLPPCPTALLNDESHVCVASNHSHPLVFAYHSGLEIWYPQYMPPLFETDEQYTATDLKKVPISSSYVECLAKPMNEDAECSNSLWLKSVKDHLNYFETSLGRMCLPWQKGEFQIVPKNTIQQNQEARQRYQGTDSINSIDAQFEQQHTQ